MYAHKKSAVASRNAYASEDEAAIEGSLAIPIRHTGGVTLDQPGESIEVRALYKKKIEATFGEDAKDSLCISKAL